MDFCEIAAEQPRFANRATLRAGLRRIALFGAGLAAVVTVVLLLVGWLLPVEAVGGRGWLFRLAILGFLMRTLSLHVGLALLVPLSVALALRRWRLAVVVGVLVAWLVAPALWDYRPRTAPAVAGESIQVMTCNLFRVNHEVNAVADEILAADPDVVFFQEYTPSWHDGLSRRLAKRYSHRAYNRRKYRMGLAIYSRRPFIGSVEMSDLDDNPPAQPMRAVVEIDGRRVALYNLHMYQPWPAAYMRRRLAQLAGIHERLSRETLPVIVAGDFNATPTCPTMHGFERLNLADAWDCAGWGLGGTWPDKPFVRHLPGIRIDHVLISSEMACTECRVGCGPGSDHWPVVAQVGFRYLSLYAIAQSTDR